MSIKQKTIKQECGISGVGLHTGCQVKVQFKPAPENAGIVFIRTDLSGQPIIKVCPENVCAESEVSRCTSLGKGESRIYTVEHLMSALCGLGITNLIVEMDGKELPGLDGSSLEFLNTFKKIGVLEQNADAPFYAIQETIGVELNNCSIFAVPANDFKVFYTLDYPHPLLRSQFFNIDVNSESYERDIAPSRTFCLEREANDLRAKGLGLGANYKNTLVVGEKGILENQARFSDEFARHKILDFIGDLYLLGMPIRGHIYALKSGHTLNIQLLKKIDDQKKRYEKTGFIPCFDLSNHRSLEIDQIMKILPHRYPFLLVDRVVDLEKGKKGVGIKNVTINDNFFQGHFPQKPVMPGVMMVEAMAQLSGIIMSTNEAHCGKLAFFLSADNVKFRKVVVPGDQLVMEVEVIRDRTTTAQTRAIAKVGNDVVVEADMMFSFVEASFLRT